MLLSYKGNGPIGVVVTVVVSLGWVYGRSTCGLMAGRGHRGKLTVEDTDSGGVCVD